MCDFCELEFTRKLLHSFVENFESCGECERLHESDQRFHADIWIMICSAAYPPSKRVNVQTFKSHLHILKFFLLFYFFFFFFVAPALILFEI